MKAACVILIFMVVWRAVAGEVKGSHLPSVASSSEVSALCQGHPFEAQFVGSVSRTEQVEQSELVKGGRGRLCRFMIKINPGTFSPSQLCGFDDQTAARSTVIEKWDRQKGCPEVGDAVSGVLQWWPLRSQHKLILDGNWEHDKKNSN